MRKTIVLLAVLGLMSATPALADIVYTPVTGTGAYGDVGIIDPANPGTLNTVVVDPAYESDILEFDFGIHLSDLWYNAAAVQFAFMYDNSGLDVIGAHPLGSWTQHNYANYEWPNSEAGEMVTVNGLTHGFITSSDYEEYLVSSVVPFMHVTLHVNGGGEWSHFADFGIVAMTLASHDYSITLWPEDFGYFGGSVHVPEPATASLLIGGIAALAGGFIRRRR